MSCRSHDVSGQRVAGWWRTVTERDAVVSVCTCCTGPAPDGWERCRFCAAASERAPCSGGCDREMPAGETCHHCGLQAVLA